MLPDLMETSAIKYIGLRCFSLRFNYFPFYCVCKGTAAVNVVGRIQSPSLLWVYGWAEPHLICFTLFFLYPLWNFMRSRHKVMILLCGS